MSSQKYQAD